MPFVKALLQDEPTDVKLLLAAKLCLERGWTQRHYRDQRGHCLLAALGVACGNHLFRRPTSREQQLIRLLGRELPFHPVRSLLPARLRLMTANDSRSMTQEQILSMLERAIARQLAGTKEPHPFHRLWRGLRT